MQQIYFQWSLIWFLRIVCSIGTSGLVVQKLDNATCLINLYLVDSVKGFGITYPLDSNLSVE